MEITLELILVLASFALVYGTMEAIEEVTGDYGKWLNSIFSRFKETSFFGPRQKTAERKDRKNKFLNDLFHTILVGFTDIWHFADMIKNLILFFLLPSYLFGLEGLAYGASIWAAQTAVFHFNFHWALLKDKKNILKKLFKFN